VAWDSEVLNVMGWNTGGCFVQHHGVKQGGGRKDYRKQDYRIP
jgi:hypothetical protein